MSSKQELIAAIRAEYVKIAQIDEDATTIYGEVGGQLKEHANDPVVLSSTTLAVAKVRYLAQRYTERYTVIADLLEELDSEQERTHREWKAGEWS